MLSANIALFEFIRSNYLGAWATLDGSRFKPPGPDPLPPDRYSTTLTPGKRAGGPAVASFEALFAAGCIAFLA
jgi:hypothetical protein